MQDLLFHILIKEDDYVCIPTLISEFSKLIVMIVIKSIYLEYSNLYFFFFRGSLIFFSFFFSLFVWLTDKLYIDFCKL